MFLIYILKEYCLYESYIFVKDIVTCMSDYRWLGLVTGFVELLQIGYFK
jgi:hypothetical protein